jgi:hypothetical protein
VSALAAAADDDPRLKLVWLMVSAAPVRAQVEIERALHRELRPQPDPAAARVQELGALAAMLRAVGRPLDSVSFDDLADRPRCAGGRPPLRRRRGHRRRKQRAANTRARERRDARRRDWLVMPRADYDAHRPAGAPDSRRLVERYGRWVMVCKAADGLLPDGRYVGVGKPWRTLVIHEIGRGEIYSAADCLNAIRRCALAIGRRPSSSDYIRWRRQMVRRYPRNDRRRLGLPTYDVIKDRHHSWPEAVAAADLSDAEIAGARAAWLPQVPPAGETVAERLLALDEASLRDLGITARQRDQLVATRCRQMPLPTAVSLARLLNGSLEWLAGVDPEPGEPPAKDARLDGAALRKLRALRAVHEDGLRRRAKLTLSQWRRALAGSYPLRIDQLLLISAGLECRLEQLIAAD